MRLLPKLWIIVSRSDDWPALISSHEILRTRRFTLHLLASINSSRLEATTTVCNRQTRVSEKGRCCWGFTIGVNRSTSNSTSISCSPPSPALLSRHHRRHRRGRNRPIPEEGIFPSPLNRAHPDASKLAYSPGLPPNRVTKGAVHQVQTMGLSEGKRQKKAADK